MGVVSAGLFNLPDSNYEYYIFILGGNANWKGGVLESIFDNFDHLAKEVGPKSVILKGLNPREWTEEIVNTYFESVESVETLIPAILVTDSSPNRVNKDSLRILIALNEIENKFKSIEIFFDLLTDFTNKRNNNFVEYAKENINWVTEFNKVVELKPNFNGVGINLNALLELAFTKKQK
jgi:hypothetical protein